MATADTEIEWSACVKPILAASFGSFNKADIPELVKFIIKCEREILEHEERYASFYSSFSALAIHYLSSSAAYITKSQINSVCQATRILIKFFLRNLQRYDDQCCLSQVEFFFSKYMKQLMSLIKGLCKGVGFLQRTDVITLTSMMKSAKLPAHIKTQSGVSEKTDEEPKEIKRPRIDPCHAVLEQLMTPYQDVAMKLKGLDKPIELTDKDGDTTVSHITDPAQDMKNLFASKNITSLQQLNAGDILIDMCLDLPYLHRYVIRYQDAVLGKGFCVPNSVPDAVSVRSSFQLLMNDINIVWRVLTLPLLEPLNDERLQKLNMVVMSCLFASVTVAMVNSIVSITASGTQKGTTVTKDEENDNCAVGIVEKSLEVFNTVATAIRNSTRAGGHNLQNFNLIGAWTLLTGLQHILYMSPSGLSEKAKDAAKYRPCPLSGKDTCSEQAPAPAKAREGTGAQRQPLSKISQQGFSVLSVALGTQALNLMTSLLDDLKTESGSTETTTTVELAHLDILGQFSAQQRVQRLIQNLNLNNLLFNLAAISYRKACMLKRIQKHPVDGDAFSISDSNTYYEDDFSCSEESTGDDDDSEPILGQWFEETLAPQDSANSNNSNSQINQDSTATPDPKSPQKNLSDVSNLIPDKGEPNGYIQLGSHVFMFMNMHFLNSENDYVKHYARSSLSDQHMIILAGIMRDLDKETSQAECGTISIYFGATLGSLYDEFSQALAVYTHNILATRLLSENLQNTLLNQLGVSPKAQEDWPLQVYPRTLAVLAQILLLQQQREKDEITLKSKSEAACLLIWQRVIQTLQKYIQNPSCVVANEDSEDLNVEHMQLLLFLFHSLQLMQKKTVLLQCAQAIVNSSSAVNKVMKESQILHLSRLLLMFDYLMRNLYEAPSSLIEQMQWNLFSVHSSTANESDKDNVKKHSKMYFTYKEVEENYCKHGLSDELQGMKPRFYLLTQGDISNQETPKLDGLASNFILGSTEIVKYCKLYESLITVLLIGNQCDMLERDAENKLSYLGLCSIHYCYSLVWRLLLSLPPSITYLENLAANEIDSEKAHLLLSLIWTSRIGHDTFAGWIKDCLVKQSLTTQKAENLHRSINKATSNIQYDANVAFRLMETLVKESKELSKNLVPQNKLPQLSEIYLLDAVIVKVQVAFDEHFNKPSPTETDILKVKSLAKKIEPLVYQLIHGFMHYISSNVLHQMNEQADPPFSFSDSTLEAYDIVIGMLSSRCSKAPLNLNISNYIPSSLKNALEKWNNASLSEFPTISAWKNAFANDIIPVESYISSVQISHMATLSSQTTFTKNLSLKHLLNTLVRFAGDLLVWCPEGSSDDVHLRILFPLILNATSESVAEFVTVSLERIVGSSENDDYVEKMYTEVIYMSHSLINHYPDDKNIIDESILQECIKFMEMILDKTPGRLALEKVFVNSSSYGVVTVHVLDDFQLDSFLLATKKENLSHTFGNKVLKFFNKLFQLAEKTPSDKTLEKLCGELRYLGMVEPEYLEKWLTRLITGNTQNSEENSLVEENRHLLQTLISYMISNPSNIGEQVAGAILQALIPMGSSILSPASEGMGFSDLMLIMATLAGSICDRGHVELFQAALSWLESCKNYLSQKNVIKKLEENVITGKHQVMVDSTCYLLAYMADIVCSLKQLLEKNTVHSSRSGAASPPCGDDLHHQDLDSDWADDLEQDEDDTTGEDSDEDSLCNKLCTFTSTQKEFMNQHWYYCHTCKMVDGVGVCTICAKVCHKDHDVTYAKFGSFFCDCGAKEDGSCQALSKRNIQNTTDLSNTISSGASPFATETFLPSSLRRRVSSPIHQEKTSFQEGKRTMDESNKHRQTIAKQLEPIQDVLVNHVTSSNMLRVLLDLLQSLVPAMAENCQRSSPTGTVQRIQSSLYNLHIRDKVFETTDQLMVPTLGSQEGAFENVRMSYSGDQGQTIRQLITAHMIRRVAMCCLSSTHGKRQHLAVSHEKGKITVLQLSALLKQADSSKRKLTLTRLSSAPVPFTVLSITGNPCNEDFLAVCGLKDCHVLTFTSTGSVSDHLVLHPQLETGNFIIKALWLPGSQTELALITADFVKIYDLSMDALSPQYFFLLPSGKIRDCCLIFSGDGQRHLVLMSSAGYIYTQPMTEESSAKHGPFYVTNILEIKHPDLKESGGQVGGGGVSIYYSHKLQFLCFSYAQGKSFIAPMTTVGLELTQLFQINFKSGNGNSKPNTQPLCQWTEVPNHPGLLCTVMQTSGNPVIMMIKPDSILVQEIKVLPAKAKITDMVAIRHPSSNSEHRTTLILLCEDGSLRIYMANVEQTSYWLTPSLSGMSSTCNSKHVLRRKKSTKVVKPPGQLLFPIDFFEHCQPMVEVEFSGNDVLQIYNVQQVKHRLNTTGMYIACTKPAGFTVDVTNPDNSMVMTGVRICVGSQDLQKAPSYVELFGRSQQMTLSRSRWFDFPFTREESLLADKKISIFFGASIDPSGANMVDSIKVYGKTKDSFGWPDESDEFLGSSPVNGNSGGTSQAVDSENPAPTHHPLTLLDKLVAGILEVLDGCVCISATSDEKAPIRSVALDLATTLLTLPTTQSVQQQTKALLAALHSTQIAYHNHKDQAILNHVIKSLNQLSSQKNIEDMDPDAFYRLVLSTRTVAVARPANLVKFADVQDRPLAVESSKEPAVEVTDFEDGSSSSKTLKLPTGNIENQHFIVQLMDAFWKLHKSQPGNPAIAPVSQPGLHHIETLVQALIDIVNAFTTCDLETVPLACVVYVSLLLSEDTVVSFACKQALIRILKPRNRKRRVFIPSPPRCSTPAGMPAEAENMPAPANELPSSLDDGTASNQNQENHEVDVSDESMLLPSASPLEALLDAQAAFPPLMDMPPDADDEAMVELAIALSLQVMDQPGQPDGLSLQGLALGAQGQSVSSLEGGHYSDTTASAGASDDEGSGVDSTTGEQNVSGRSSAYGDTVPESGTTGARSETSSVGAPSTSMQPEGEGSEPEADVDTNCRLHALRLALLKSLLQYTPMLKDVGGVRAIPFMQVILMLSSDLDGEEEKDKAVLDMLLTATVAELDMSSKDAATIAQRTSRHEVQLVIMRLLSVMMSRMKTGTKPLTESVSFIGTCTANSLLQHNTIDYCLQVLKVLLDHWKQSHAEDGTQLMTGSLLKTHPPHPPPDMSPFFLRQYVKGHPNDVFEAYPQLLTEMVLRLPYQIRKLVEGGTLEQTWYPCLCEYLMLQQTPFIRRQVRKLLLFMCGSKEHYRQLRDLHALESHVQAVRTFCERAIQIVLPYDSLLNLIEHLKACAEIATMRTSNWQQFCSKDDTVLPFLLQVSFQLDEGVAAIILQLLQSATCGPAGVAVQVPAAAPQSPGSPVKSKKDYDDAGEEYRCRALIQQIHQSVDKSVLANFIRSFLLESNSTAMRWQAHMLLHGLYCASNNAQQETLLDLLWKLWPQLPLYGRKAAQFVDLLGYFTLRTSQPERRVHDYVDKAVSVMRMQNQVLTNHPNANIYNALQGLVEFDGYYLESDPCLVCNNPEIPFSNVKLTAIKVDSRFTTTTQIIKLVGSYTVSKITLRIGDLKRTKMVRTINVYYNNRSVQAVVELKNKPSMWHKAKKCHLSAGQTELKIEFPLPIVACNLMIEYADFYENLQASSETLQCPRCSASVPANPGVCANCGENVFQCQKCRCINYDEKDPFLCNACGFCKYAKFDYTLTAKPCCAVDPIENEEDRKKAITTINSLLEKADRVYKQLIANKPSLEALLLRINEHSIDRPLDDANGNAVNAGSSVNKTIQQLAQRYCGDCRASFDELSKIIQKVLASRRELVEYDHQQRELTKQSGGSLLRSSDIGMSHLCQLTPQEKHNITVSGRCYGCASAAIEHCITLLRAMATNPRMRQILCSQGLIKDLVEYNLRRGTVQVRSEVRQLICLLTRDNSTATDELNSLLMNKISMSLRGHVTSPDLSAAVRHEMALLANTIQKEDSCWEQRLRCVMSLFLMGVNSRSPVVMENITLPCLRILQSLIHPEAPMSKKNKEKSVENMATVKAGATEVRVDMQKWLAGDVNQTYKAWKQKTPIRGIELSGKKISKEEIRSRYLMEKYGNRWRDKTRKDVVHLKLLYNTWLRSVLFNPSSRSARQVACNMVEALCQIPSRKREVLDMLTVYLDDLSEAGENAAEFLMLYQNLMKSAHWKYYLAVRGVLPHIGEHIMREINDLTRLEETTLNSDLSQGYALKMLTELLSSFLEQESIRQHYKGKLVGMVLNGYLCLRKLVVQRTKLIDETQDKLLDLLEDMTTGTETETQAFMAVCVETVKKYGLDDFRTPVFIFERLCSVIYPEENDIGEFFLTLEKDPQQEDFLQGRMPGNPYSSNEPGLGPLMRDVKNKICQDCELVALLEDDNGMELLVANKIISLDLPVKEVYKKIWLAENSEGDAMRIVYRMRGLLGDATEEFIETLNAKSDEEIDNEEVYRMANIMSTCGGLEVMLERLNAINDLSRGRSLLLVLLRLFNYCIKVRSNRQKLLQANLNAIQVMLNTLKMVLSADSEIVLGQPTASSLAEQLMQVMETILVEANNQPTDIFQEFASSCGSIEDICQLMQQIKMPVVRQNPNVQQRLLRVLPFLTLGIEDKMSALISYFKPTLNFNHFDFEHSSDDELILESFCVVANGIEKNSYGNQLKDLIIKEGIVNDALEYIQMHTPPIRTELLIDSEEWKEFISKPALKFVLRMLTGLCSGHLTSQLKVSTDCIPIIHRLEQVSSDEHVGSLAENLMEALRENSCVAEKIEEVRKQTKAEKKRLAMAMREKQLAGLGMCTNEKGQVTAKSSILKQMEELVEEPGLVCVICREGYKFQPTKVLGIYTFTKRTNADDVENKPRKTPAYATVTHFNVVHIDCHLSAVRLARGRDEWESAALQNANTKCNGLLPLWGPQVPESAFASCLARHNTYLQECTGYRDISYSSTMHDLKLLLLRFAFEKSFSDDSGGGGPQSNMHLFPYILHMALYVINTTQCLSREEKNINNFLEMPVDKWADNCFEAEGPLYWSIMAMAICPFAKWQQIRTSFLKRFIVLGQARHLHPQGTTKLTDYEVKEYNVYKPYLIFYFLVEKLFTFIFKKVTVPNAESDWPTSLANYIRMNDSSLLEAGDRVLTAYQEEMLPCQSFGEFCDIVDLLNSIADPDAFLVETLCSLAGGN